MKRRAPQKRQTARKSSRTSLHITNIVRHEEDEEELVSDEEETIIINRSISRIEFTTDEMMTDDANEEEQIVEQQETNQANNGQLSEIKHDDNEITSENIVHQEINLITQSDKMDSQQSNSQPNSQSDVFLVSLDSTYLTPPETLDKGGSNQNNSQSEKIENVQQVYVIDSQEPASSNIQNIQQQPATAAAVTTNQMPDLDDDLAQINLTHIEQPKEETGWLSERTVHAFKYKYRVGVTDKNKIAAFDLDGTLIKPKSKNKFSKDINDWQPFDRTLQIRIKKLIEDGFNFVIFSNQMGVSHKFITLAQIKKKFENVIKFFNLPCVALLATNLDKFRKPATGMLEFYKTINQTRLDVTQSLFVGDAMGRIKDHSAADLLFAFNCRLPFVPIESFLSGFERPKLYKYDQLIKLRVPRFPIDPLKRKDPQILTIKKTLADNFIDYFSVDELVNEITHSSDNKPFVILLIGLSGSGKSFLVENNLQNDNFAIIDDDSTGNLDDNMRLFEVYVSEKKSIVIDQANLDFSVRKQWIQLAKKHSMLIFGIHLNLNVDQCLHNVRFRSYYTDEKRRAPTKTELLKQHVNFKALEYFEGFEKIFQLDFIPKLKTNNLKVYYSHFLYDKP